MPLSFDATVGPLFVFVSIAFMLYGTFVAQLYYYYVTYVGDRPALRFYVWIMGLLETSHTALCLVFLYWYLIMHFGDVGGGIALIHWSIRSTVILEILMVYMAQMLSCWRIWRVHTVFNESIVLTAIPIFLSSTRLFLGLTSYGLMAKLDAWQLILNDHALQATLTATYAVELAADATITALLVYGLWDRRTPCFARSNDVIQRLVFYTLNTGASNIICSAAVIITFNLTQESLAFAGIIEMRSKLYANIMMALLNTRQVIFAHRDIPLPTLLNSGNRETRVRIFTDTVQQVVHNDYSGGGNDSSDVKPVQIVAKNHGVS